MLIVTFTLQHTHTHAQTQVSLSQLYQYFQSGLVHTHLLCLHYPRFFLFLFPPWRSNRRIHKSSSPPSTAATTTLAYVIVSRFLFSTVTNWPIVTIIVIITTDFFVVSPTVHIV
jgi:hypothetical protein